MTVWLPITALLAFIFGYITAIYFERKKFDKLLESALSSLRDENKAYHEQNKLLKQSNADVAYKCSQLEKDNRSAREQIERYKASKIHKSD